VLATGEDNGFTMLSTPEQQYLMFKQFIVACAEGMEREIVISKKKYQSKTLLTNARVRYILTI
jgi:hypothetical protein